MTVKILIKEAKKALLTPFDTVHDERHHLLVWENCRKIVKEEKLDVDMEALEVAAMWHDVERDEEDETKLLKEAFDRHR